MTLRINTVKITGMPSANGWSQSYEYSSEEVGISSGTSLIIVFSTIRGGDQIDAVIGRNLLKKFKDLYFSDNKRSPDFALKEAVQKTFDDYFQEFDGLEIASASFTNGVLYTTCINGGKASLYRDGFLVKILDSTGPQIVSASGYPKEGDIMLLATADLYKKMPYFSLKESLSKGVHTAADEFSIELHNMSTAGVCLMVFEKNGRKTPPFESDKEKEPKNFALKEKLFSLTTSFLNLSKTIKEKIPRKKIYVDRQSEDYAPVRNRKAALVGLILIILLSVSVLFGMQKSKTDKFKEAYSNDLNSARTYIENAIQLKSVDIVKSRENFLNGREIITKLEEEKISDPEIEKIKTLISENEEDVLGEKRIDAQMWLDLTLITDNFNTNAISFYDDKLNFLDSEKKAIVTIQVDDKKSTTTKIPDEIKDATKLITRNDGIFVLTNSGVYSLSEKSRVIDKNWSDSVLIQPFSSNIYILDKSAGEILKSSGIDNGFSEAKKWTTKDSVDFSGARSFVLDGYVWVLNPKSEILKFSYGNEIKFQLKNYPFDLPDYDYLYTSDDVDELYLLSKKDGIVSIFNKDREYILNILSNGFANAEDFIVTNDGTIFVLSGNKIYQIKR